MGQPEVALRLAGYAIGLRETVNSALSPEEQSRVDRTLGLAVQAIGSETSALLRAEGKDLSQEAANAYASAIPTKDGESQAT
ncbi:MAG: hypothetical protein Q7O66_22570 [Dehalococcoidia bacterium]|nr:hypothetical protein [Dehalococcoidia bacterium]